MHRHNAAIQYEKTGRFEVMNTKSEKKFCFGVSLNSLSDSIDDTLVELVVNSKIKTLELSQRLFLENAEQVKLQIRKLSDAKIKTASIHTDFWSLDISSTDKEARKKAVLNAFAAIELAEEFGAQIIVLHPSIEPITREERNVRKTHAKKSIREIAEKCSDKNKRLAIELLPRTCLGNCAEELIELADGLPEEAIGFCLDTNHLMDKPFILADIVKLFGKRLIATHLSDYDGVDEKHQVPGAGVIDWKAFMEALKEINYSGPFNFECAFRNNEPTMKRISLLQEAYNNLISL